MRVWLLVPPLLVLMAYGQTLNYPFVYDDLASVTGDPVIAGADTIAQAANTLLATARPVTRFSYAATHALFGFSRSAFHATNIFIHMLNRVLVFLIGRALARCWLLNADAVHFGLIAAAIHAVHPLYTEAVTYVSGRSSSLCALFYFGCLFLVIHAVEVQDAVPRRLWYCAAAVSGLLAWATKEEAITLPFIVAVFLSLNGHRKAPIVLAAIPAVVLAIQWQALSRLYQTSAANESLVQIGMGAPVETLPYILSVIKASVLYYLSHLAIPMTQSVDPDFPLVRSIVEPGFLLAAAALLLLAGIAVRFSRRQPVVTFSIAALLVSPLLAYAALPLADVVAEHRVYISGLGFDLLLALALIHARRFKPVSIAAVVVSLTAVSIARNSVWASDIRLWQQAEVHSQNQVRPHVNLGAAYQSARDFSRAFAEYRHALAIRPDLPIVYSNMGTIYLEQGRVMLAEETLKRAIEFNPSLPRPYINLAAIAIYRNKPDEALTYLEKAEKAGAANSSLQFFRARVSAISPR